MMVATKWTDDNINPYQLPQRRFVDLTKSKLTHYFWTSKAQRIYETVKLWYILAFWIFPHFLTIEFSLTFFHFVELLSKLFRTFWQFGKFEKFQDSVRNITFSYNFCALIFANSFKKGWTFYYEVVEKICNNKSSRPWILDLYAFCQKRLLV